MARVTDMTHGRPIRLILLFSLPLMLGSVFQQLYTIVDTIIIGRGVGMQALASIGAADWINWLVLWGLQGFTQGFAILAAQEFGAGAYDRLRRVLAMIIKLSCWFGIAVTIISLLLVRPLLTLLHTDPAVFGGAQTYLYMCSSAAHSSLLHTIWRQPCCAVWATVKRRCSRFSRQALPILHSTCCS